MEKNSQGFPGGKMSPELRFKGFEGEWEKKKLGEICNFSKGRGYSKNDLRRKGIPIVLYGRLYTKYELCINHVDTCVEPIKEALCSKGGEIIIPASGETAEDISIASVIMTPGIIIGGDLNVLYPCDAYSPFFALVISNGSTHNELSQKAQGKTIVHLHNSSIKCTSVVYPRSITEQTKIGNLFISIDRQFSLHQKKLEGLKRLKHSMLVKMFPKEGATIPEIRFKGFEGEWEKKRLEEFANKILEKNILNEYSITLTNSAEFGIIDQRDYFDRNVSNVENINGYYVVRQDDFVYNPRISTIAPVGPINRNKTGLVGVMSPLYFVFRTNEVDYTYLEYYFKGNCWHRYMFLNGNSGARSDRFSISDDVFMKISIAMPKDIIEQIKIGQYFQSLDRLISLHEQKLNKLKNLKTSLLQKMFV